MLKVFLLWDAKPEKKKELMVREDVESVYTSSKGYHLRQDGAAGSIQFHSRNTAVVQEEKNNKAAWPKRRNKSYKERTKESEIAYKQGFSNLPR